MQQISESGVVEPLVMNWEIPLRIDASEHTTVAVKIVGRVAIEEVTPMARNGLFKRPVPHFQPRASKASHLVDQSVEPLQVFVDSRHPSQKAWAIAQVVVEPVVRRQLQAICYRLLPCPVPLQTLFHLGVGSLVGRPLLYAVGQLDGRSQLNLPIVRENVENVVALH